MPWCWRYAALEPGWGSVEEEVDFRPGLNDGAFRTPCNDLTRGHPAILRVLPSTSSPPAWAQAREQRAVGALSLPDVVVGRDGGIRAAVVACQADDERGN